MKTLEVPLLNNLSQKSSLEEISFSLDHLQRHLIGIAPWPKFMYTPKVEFSIAHNNEFIFLKYFIEEEELKAVYHKTNDPVYKDSCVEFFIAWDNEEGYYNIEINAIGTCKLNFGVNRNSRIEISEYLIKTIKHLSVIQNKDIGVKWELTLRIPFLVFSQHNIKTLSGKTCNANFYKCGDDLPTPHFICWNTIDTPEPDFHQRRCFGKLLFL